MRCRPALAIATATLTLTWAALALPALAGAGGAQTAFGDEARATHPIPEGSTRWVDATDLAARSVSGKWLRSVEARLRPSELLLFKDAESAVAWGKLDRETFTASRALTGPTSLAEVLLRSEAGCSYTKSRRHYMSPEIGPEDTFAELVMASSAIASGVVTGLQGGFHSRAGLGLLIQIEVKDWLKYEDASDSPPVIHAFYPRGDFRIGSSRICALSAGWPEPPAPGARIVVSTIGLNASDPTFFPIRNPAGRIAFESGSGVMVAPKATRAFQEFRVVRIEQLERLFRGEVRRQQRQAGSR